MTTLYLQHGSATDLPMRTERVQHKVTAVPSSKSMHGDIRMPTAFMVRMDGRWSRVWQHTDGSRYITRSYRRIPVIFQD